LDINVIFSLISTFVSVVAFLVSLFVVLTNWRYARPKLNIFQLNEAVHSVIFKSHDGCIVTYEDGYDNTDLLDNPPIKSVALAEICITNESSLPISVINFHIDGASAFDSYSNTIDYLKATVDPLLQFSAGNENNKIKYLKPEFTLDPYTTKRGFLFFWMTNEDSVKPNVNIPLIISTSRKTFSFYIRFSDSYESIKKHKHIDKDGNETILDDIPQV
jgi:hypothetical protein